MTRETREYEVATYDELTEEQQQEVISNYQDINTDDDYWVDDVNDDHVALLEDLGFNGVKIAYSGFWS